MKFAQLCLLFWMCFTMVHGQSNVPGIYIPSQGVSSRLSLFPDSSSLRFFHSCLASYRISGKWYLKKDTLLIHEFFVYPQAPEKTYINDTLYFKMMNDSNLCLLSPDSHFDVIYRRLESTTLSQSDIKQKKRQRKLDSAKH